MSKNNTVIRRDSLEFDRSLKELRDQIEADVGVRLDTVQLTSMLAKDLKKDNFLARFTIVVNKRGRPKSII